MNGGGCGVSSFYKIMMNIFNVTHNIFVPVISASTFLYHMEVSCVLFPHWNSCSMTIKQPLFRSTLLSATLCFCAVFFTLCNVLYRQKDSRWLKITFDLNAASNINAAKISWGKKGKINGKKVPVILLQCIKASHPNVSLNKFCSFRTLCHSINPAGFIEWLKH